MPTQTAKSRAALAESIFDLSRGRQALLSVAQPALGALLALGSLPTVPVIALGLVAAATGYLAVFSLNDVLDRHADKKALEAARKGYDGYDIDIAFVRHPLARGDISLRVSLAWVGFLSIVSAVCAYLLSPACAGLFAVSVALHALYCGLRSVTWAKTFVSGLMVGVGGLAGWVAVAPLSAGALPFFAFLALWEIAGRNLPNDLADLADDSAVGIRTVATVFGPRVSARATAVAAWATLVPLAFLGGPALATALAFSAGVVMLGVPALVLAAEPNRDRAAIYFNRASLLPPVVMLPMLISAIAR